MNDGSLDKRFAGGGEAELEEVINYYGERLLRYATAIICDYHEAENVVQEVFIAAYKARDGFDGANLSAWLYRITYNHCINHIKRRRFWMFEINPNLAAPEPDRGLSDETLRALKRLKPKDRALLYGRIFEGLSYDELSAQTGKSSAALRKQYERARRKLAGYLSNTGKEQAHEYIQ